MIIDRKAAQRMIRGQLVMVFQVDRPKVLSGKHYPIQPRNRSGVGRPDPSIGRFLVKGVQLVRWDEVTQWDAQAAGFSDRLDLRRHLVRKLGAEFDGNKQLFWRIEFEIIQREERIAA